MRSSCLNECEIVTGPRRRPLSLRFAVDTHCRLHTLSREEEGPTEEIPPLPLPLSPPFPLSPFCSALFYDNFLCWRDSGGKTGTLHANSGLRINEDGQRRRQRTYCTRFKGHFGTRVTGLRIRRRLRFAMEDRSKWRRRETVFRYCRYHNHHLKRFSGSLPFWRNDHSK